MSRNRESNDNCYWYLIDDASVSWKISTNGCKNISKYHWNNGSSAALLPQKRRLFETFSLTGFLIRHASIPNANSNNLDVRVWVRESNSINNSSFAFSLVTDVCMKCTSLVLLVFTCTKAINCNYSHTVKKGSMVNPKSSRNSVSTLQGFKTTARTLFSFMNSSVSWKTTFVVIRGFLTVKKVF